MRFAKCSRCRSRRREREIERESLKRMKMKRFSGTDGEGAEGTFRAISI